MEVRIEKMCFTLLADDNILLSKMLRLGRRKKTAERLLCLSGVDLNLKVGSVSAILGSSFESKQLLDIIALRQTEGFLSGSITHDGVVRSNGIYRDIAYIPCEDNIHFEKLRVFESLYYAARLRLVNRDIECRERAREAARILGLDGSSFVCKLDQCERRLFSIGMELVGNPSLICIHYPTAGLDASSALEVCRCLHKISRRQNSSTTIVYTISPPSAEMLAFTDELVVIAGPLVVFAGPVTSRSDDGNLVRLASKIAVEMLLGSTDTTDRRALDTNKRIKLLGLEMNNFKSPTLSNSGEGFGLSAGPLREFGRRKAPDLSPPVRTFKPVWKEVYLLVARAVQFARYDKYQVRMSIVRLCLCGLVLGGILYGAGENLDTNISSASEARPDKNAYNVTSCLFAIVILSINGLSLSIPLMHSNIKALRYEVSQRLHRPVSSWLSMVIVEMPIYAIAGTGLGLIVYGMVDIAAPCSVFVGSVILIILTAYRYSLTK